MSLKQKAFATILAVDDDEMVLRLVDQILRAEGYTVVTADGGRKALETYESLGTPIQLLLTDVMMPDLSGQVLFISGFHESQIVQQFATNRGFSVLHKPFTPDGLLREVRHSLAITS
jgi:two-component system cell cycle sensor histidine kinase/response regulator CckA